MKPLIEAGKLYIAMPPLYKLSSGKTSRMYGRKNKEKRLWQTESETRNSKI